MTRDEMIRMAIQCQLVTTANRDGVYMDALERFAALVAAAVAAAEREACAKLAESLPMQQEIDVRDQCAAAIRARGEK
jgi:hypothetical protein